MAEKASPKLLAQLVKHSEMQGVSVTRTRKGLLFRFPDGNTEMVHFTPSDHRWQANTRAAFRRSGISWPGDDKPAKVPDNIVNATLSRTSRDRARAALVHLGNPTDVTIQEITAAVLELTGIALVHVTASRMLYHSGFRPTTQRRRKALIWERDLTESEAAAMFAETPTEPEPEPAAAPADVEPATVPEREFIDSVDSWTLQLDAVPASWTIADLHAFAAAAGLGIEIRTWRAI